MNIDLIDSVAIESSNFYESAFEIAIGDRINYVPTLDELNILLSKITSWSRFTGYSSFGVTSQINNYININDIPKSEDGSLLMIFDCGEDKYFVNLKTVISDIRDRKIMLINGE